MSQIAFTAALAVQAASKRFSIFAYAGGKLSVDGFDLPIVVELKTLQARPGYPVIIDHNATTDHTLGQVDKIDNDGQGVTIGGAITGDHHSPVSHVLMQAAKGHKWEASIGATFDAGESVIVKTGETMDVNGQSLAGPFILARNAMLRETSILPMGADSSTRVNLAAKAALQAKGRTMPDETKKPETFEAFCDTLGVDEKAANEPLKAMLKAQFDGFGEKKEEPAAETTDEKTAEATAAINLKAAAKLDDPVLKERVRIAAEYDRIEQIKAACASSPAVIKAAIAGGWDVNKAKLTMYEQRDRERAPAGHSSSHEGNCTLQALEGAMILRAGGRLDHPSYQRRGAYAMRVPAWLRAGINDAQRNQYMEAATRYADMSMVDLAREACRLDGHEAPSNRGEMIRAAFSGGSLTSIFTTNVNTQILSAYEEVGDQTQEWTQETEVADFKSNERPRMEKGPNLARLPRGGTADDFSRSDVAETFKIARYAKKFQVDEQDIIDDTFNALADTPKEMGMAAARLRPDLVYAVLMSNPTLAATTRALFHATEGNLDTSAALGTATLKAAITAMMLFQEQGVSLGLMPTHIIVPPTLRYTAWELLQSPTIVITGTTDAARGSMNTLSKEPIKVIADHRLENGVIDPATGTTYAGSASTWYLACSIAHTILVAYLRGTGRAPQVRKYMLDKGQWGVGWDINMDIGAKAMDWKGLHKATA